jgi:hypothetical protein
LHFFLKNLVVRQKMSIFAAQTVLLMTRRILKYAFAMTLSLAVPVLTLASEMAAPEFATEQSEPVISVQQSSVTVTGAAGQTLEVVSLTGKSVMSVRIDSPSQRIELNVPKGCYILKVGKVVRKVTIR